MGWGQPTNGKRARHCSDENKSEFAGSSETLKKEMKSPFGKRHRDISPIDDKISSEEDMTQPSSHSFNQQGPSGAISFSNPGCSYALNGCRNDKEYSNLSSNIKIGYEIDSNKMENNSQDTFKDFKIRTFKPKSPTSSRASSPMSSNRISNSNKGPKVLSCKSRTAIARSFSRKNSSKNRKLTKASPSSSSDGTSECILDSGVILTEGEDNEDDLTDDDICYNDLVDLEFSKGNEEYAEDNGSATTSSSVDVVPSLNVARRVLPSLRPSYFPNVPPYLNFCLHDERTEPLPQEIQKHLKWRLSPITPVVVKKTLTNSGFRILRKTVEWNGQWGKHMKAVLFKSSMKDFQKLNHLPGTFQIGRKDRLWRNIHRFMNKFGKEEFGFIPRTYILPVEVKQLKTAWESSDGKKQLWIVKPPAGARGTGIRVVNKWSQVPKKKPVIVQAYIADPYLINDRKFDLRVYVLVTSFHPLKVYIYNDGLVRFAPVKYSHDTKRAGDRFMHLTNYSVNKNCELYTQNEDADACQGHKWTLKSLWRHFESEGKNVHELWDRIEEIVIKTLIAAEEPITAASHNLPNRYTGYELFGFDIILDTQLKPWLLEVNISPSLHSSSPLDLAVKGPLITEVFNIVGFHLPPKYSHAIQTKLLNSLDVKLDLETPVFDKRLYSSALSKEEINKHKMFKGVCGNRNEYLDKVLEHLTPDDIRQLITSEDELSQCDGFCRVFPSPSSHTYFPYFESPRYYNILFDAWEQKYHNDRSQCVKDLIQMCHDKIHLQVPVNAGSMISENQVSDKDPEKSQDNEKNPTEAFEQEPQELEHSSNELIEATKALETDSKHNSIGSPVSTVLDNITNNSSRSLVGVSLEEEIFSNSKTGTPIPNKAADYVKGVCY